MTNTDYDNSRELAAQDFVSVQPMNLPSGLIFYLNFKYGTAQAGHDQNSDIHGNTSGSNKFNLDQNGHLMPGANNAQDLGSGSLRWRNLYTQDLKLSNEAKKDEGGNDVDGTWGDYTIQEGESDLFLINNRSGKKYKFMLKEVS